MIALIALLAVAGAGLGRTLATREIQASTRTADTTFAATVARLSEPAGYFDSDNLISNETSYLHVVSRLRAAGIEGGAYVGVGPDQNYSYIAAVRPTIAYIIDIRRDNLLTHLMFKALFQRSTNRLEFLSRWTGRPVPRDAARWTGRPIEEILARVDSIPPDEAATARQADSMMAAVSSYGVPLTITDSANLRRFIGEFATHGLDLRFTSTGRAPRYYYPTLRQLILERDLDGAKASYLASEDSWRFIKRLHDTDRIIPVVGNLAGTSAFPAISRDVAARGLTVAALYVSNVEMYIWRDGSFPSFARTAANLPRSSESLLIRSYFGGGFGRSHPLNQPPHVSTQLVQSLDDFAARHSAGGWSSYWELVTLGNRN